MNLQLAFLCLKFVMRDLRDLAVVLSVSSLENGFQSMPLLSAEFSSHKIYMGNAINMIGG
jgi:hypothetical protein